MRIGRSCVTLLLGLILVFTIGTGSFAGGFKYEPKMPHLGKDISPAEAYEMVKKDPEHTFLVDVRTRPEYQLIGHPEGSYNVPFQFWTSTFGSKKYKKVDNPDFGEDLLARFNPKTDTLLILCRSAKRSCKATNAAVKAGFAEDKVFNVMGGVEGDKVKNRASAYSGQRKYGGWKNEGLPWTYHMDPKLVYKKDTEKRSAAK